MLIVRWTDGHRPRDSTRDRSVAPDNLIDPKRLTPLTRTSLKEAFRAVAKVQCGVGAKQGFTWR
jgi:hypothetical protein